MRNITRDKMLQTQQAISNPFKDIIEGLKELNPKYNNGFTQQLYTISVNTILY